MRRAELLTRLRSRKVLIPLAIVVVLIATLVIVGVTSSSPGYRTVSKMITGTPEADGAAVQLDTTLYLPDTTPAPAVLLAQGFGGDKSDLAGTAQTLAEHGYVALAYTARGFGDSGGLIHFDSPKYEVHDAKLLAGYHQRIKAVAADITWNNLQHALFPNAAGNSSGVFKKLWAGTLFGNAFSSQLGALLDAARNGKAPTVPKGTVSCGRFAPDVCAAYQNAAQTGTPNAAMRALMAQASPASILNRIKAPTLLTQGEQDSLFSLGEADANARGIAANGTPVKVVWRRGGHDDSSRGGDDATSQMLSWFGKVFGSGVSGKQPFDFSEQGASLSSDSGRLRQQIRQAPAYPGIN